jgi:hypothetical protein
MASHDPIGDSLLVLFGVFIGVPFAFISAGITIGYWIWG